MAESIQPLEPVLMVGWVPVVHGPDDSGGGVRMKIVAVEQMAPKISIGKTA
jgi:hypothetical protein